MNLKNSAKIGIESEKIIELPNLFKSTGQNTNFISVLNESTPF